MDKVCLKCWKHFSAKNKKRKYCSKECAYADRITHEKKVCEHCWKIFKPQKSSQRFCSQKCYNSTHRKNWMGNIECLNCGRCFHPKNKDTKFCSLGCAYEYRTIIHGKWICLQCWKEFTKTATERKFCSRECSNQAQIKNGIIECPICWEKFKARNASSIYCSRECAYKSFTTEEYKNNLKEIALQKMNERWYMWSVQLPQVKASNKVISKPNLKYKDLLEELWYEVEMEFCLCWYSYDIKIWNILIEINPTPFHNSTRNPLTKPKAKEYHYNKCQCAIANWYKCIMVWDWTTNEELLNFINVEFGYEWPSNLHRYNIKTKEHLIDTWYNKDDMTSKWFVEIYDCWNIVYK